MKICWFAPAVFLVVLVLVPLAAAATTEEQIFDHKLTRCSDRCASEQMCEKYYPAAYSSIAVEMERLRYEHIDCTEWNRRDDDRDCDAVYAQYSAAVTRYHNAKNSATDLTYQAGYDACDSKESSCKSGCSSLISGGGWNCYDHIDCQFREDCVNGACVLVRECYHAGECAEGQACVNNKCTEDECTYPRDCPEGMRCIDHKCSGAGGEDCTNGSDDDGDGDVDCDDPDCASHSACDVECHEDSDCEPGEVCQYGFCIVPEEQFRYTLTADTEKRDFYMNGTNAVQLVFLAEQLVDGAWQPAAGETVEWSLRCSYSSCTNVGRLEAEGRATNSQGKAKSRYIMPQVSAKDVQWIGRKYQEAEVLAMHVKGGESKGGESEHFNVYPPIYIKSIEIAPNVIQEGSGRAVVKVVIFNRKDSDVYIEATTRHDWLFDSPEGGAKLHEFPEIIKAGTDTVRFYVVPATGINSLDFDDMPDWESAEEAIKHSIKESVGVGDLVFVSINTGFSLTKFGKAASNIIGSVEVEGGAFGESGEIILTHVMAPGNIGADFMAGLGWSKTANRIGQSRSFGEGFWNATALIVDATGFCVGVLAGPMGPSSGLKGAAAGAGKSLSLTVIFNSASNFFRETADMVRIANAESVLYPRVIKVKIVDEDLQETGGYVPYYIERFE